MSSAEVEGAQVGSTALTFVPHEVRGGEHHHAIGTAGSTTLVLQTVLLPLLLADEPATLTLQGGTHNPFAPPFDFLAKAYIPLLRRMGATVELELHRPGFHPGGGGRFTARITPIERLRGIELLERGRIVRRHATAMVANLPLHIAEREIAVIGKKLGWGRNQVAVEVIENAAGPGNVVLIEIEAEHVTEVGNSAQLTSCTSSARLVPKSYGEGSPRRWQEREVSAGVNGSGPTQTPQSSRTHHPAKGSTRELTTPRSASCP